MIEKDITLKSKKNIYISKYICKSQDRNIVRISFMELFLKTLCKHFHNLLKKQTKIQIDPRAHTLWGSISNSNLI
jgi:hypothetical protein